MASRKLQRLKLDMNLRKGIDNANKKKSQALQTVGDVLHLTVLDLMQKIDLPVGSARKLLALSSQALVAQATNAWELLQSQTEKVATGVISLDRALCGGLRCGELTEVTGKIGSGKTQFCLSMTCSAIFHQFCFPMKGHRNKYDATTEKITSNKDLISSQKGNDFLQYFANVGVIYFDTEGMFSPRKNETSHEIMGTLLNALLKRIQVFRVHSLKEFMDKLALLEHSFLIEHRSNLIIVDSIPSLIEKEEVKIQKRQQLLGTIAAKLKFVAETFKVVVIATNHLTDKGNAGASTIPAPALGNSWAHCVNTRLIILQKQLSKNAYEPDTSFTWGINIKAPWRHIEIIVHKSPLLGPTTFPCMLAKSGFCDHAFPDVLPRAT